MSKAWLLIRERRDSELRITGKKVLAVFNGRPMFNDLLGLVPSPIFAPTAIAEELAETGHALSGDGGDYVLEKHNVAEVTE